MSSDSEYVGNVANNHINHDKLSASALLTQGVDVTSSNVHIGLKVRRGKDWNNKKWRDDIDKGSDYIPNIPKERVGGRVIGFTDANGKLVGDNSGRKYDTDRITAASGPGWAVVEWSTGKSSVYPIGAEDVFSLHVV